MSHVDNSTPSTAGLSQHVFISYSRKDLSFAKYLRLLLEQDGQLDVWMDTTQLSAGMVWSKELENALDSCGALVVIMSPHSQESKFVQSEILHAMDRNKPIFPVLLQGTEPFFLLRAYQTEMMQGGLSAKLSPEFIHNLQTSVGVVTTTEKEGSTSGHKLKFEVQQANALDFCCDVMVLKFAGMYLGVDSKIERKFCDEADRRKDDSFRLDTERLEQNETIFRATEGIIGAQFVLYVPTDRMSEFDYNSIRDFTQTALDVLSNNQDMEHVAMTIHGVGFGLDEMESFVAQLDGLLETIQTSPQTRQIRRISLIEYNSSRVARLKEMAASYFADKGITWNDHSDIIFNTTGIAEIRPKPIKAKPNALVIGPQDNDEDFFHFGIEQPVHSMGLLCEKIQISSSGANMNEELEKQFERIQRATAIIVVLESPPSSWLTCLLGYAWGCKLPTILIAKERDQDLIFDKKHYITYQKIWELQNQLGQWLLHVQNQNKGSGRTTSSLTSEPQNT